MVEFLNKLDGGGEERNKEANIFLESTKRVLIGSGFLRRLWMEGRSPLPLLHLGTVPVWPGSRNPPSQDRPGNEGNPQTAKVFLSAFLVAFPSALIDFFKLKPRFPFLSKAFALGIFTSLSQHFGASIWRNVSL